MKQNEKKKHRVAWVVAIKYLLLEYEVSKNSEENRD